MKGRERSNSMVEEEEKELLGYQPHIRTIMEDIDSGINKKVRKYSVKYFSFFSLVFNVAPTAMVVR